MLRSHASAGSAVERFLALVVVSVSGAICAASCAQPEDIEAPLATPDDAALMSPAGDEPTGEAQQDLLKIVRCTGNELGAECERKCEAAGVWCPAGYEHPRNSEGGVGELFECRGLLGAKTCWYY